MVEHDFGALWAVLSESSVPDVYSLAVAPASVLADGREILAGIDARGNRQILIPLRSAEQFSDAGGGWTLQLRQLDVDGKRYASAVCTDRRLDDVFSQFCRELAASVVDSGKPGRDMRVAFGRWRALFSTPANQLSKAEEIGLLGELLTLHTILGLGGSVASWEGPTKSLHDFRQDAHRLEVKATLAREGINVTVHGVDQLDCPSGSDLHLLVYRFTQDDQGSSLIDLVRQIENEVDDLVLFEAQLRRSGFDWQFSSGYETTYSVSDIFCYDVQQDGFPRITSASFVDGQMPAGTWQLTYVVDLAGSTLISLPPDNRLQVMVSLAGAP